MTDSDITIETDELRAIAETLREQSQRLEEAESIIRAVVETRQAQRYYFRTRRADALENAKQRERALEARLETYQNRFPLFQKALPL